MVTVSFQFSVFTGFGDTSPEKDTFYLAYATREESERHIFFCANDERATRSCNGSGATYELAVEIPRGSELVYTVFRIPGADSTHPEIVESGREVVDADWSTRSHYRYGAANPGGYD